MKVESILEEIYLRLTTVLNFTPLFCSSLFYIFSLSFFNITPKYIILLLAAFADLKMEKKMTPIRINLKYNQRKKNQNKKNKISQNKNNIQSNKKNKHRKSD
jgi:hypothetical protein